MGRRFYFFQFLLFLEPLPNVKLSDNDVKRYIKDKQDDFEWATKVKERKTVLEQKSD